MATCHFADFERVKSIIVGSPNSDYENSQLKSLDVKNCVGLETLVVANCPNLADKELDFDFFADEIIERDRLINPLKVEYP